MWIPDRQHQADIGTSVYMVNWTILYIREKAGGNAHVVLGNLNKRIKECPRFPGIRLPNAGFTQDHMTSTKRRHMLWVVPYAMRGLLGGVDGERLEAVFTGEVFDAMKVCHRFPSYKIFI